MVTVAKNAMAINPNIKDVLLFETTPRYDNTHKIDMFAQMKLQEAKDRANDHRILIGKHSLACTDRLRVSMSPSRGSPGSTGCTCALVPAMWPTPAPWPWCWLNLVS